MKIPVAVSLALSFAGIAIAADLPRGTFEAKDLDKAKAKAAESKKLIAFLYTDKNTTCPLCQNAAAEFIDAAKSKSIIVYVDSPSTSTVWPTLPEPVKKALGPGKYIPKMAVTDATAGTVVASINYDTFKADDSRSLRAFKKALKPAK